MVQNPAGGDHDHPAGAGLGATGGTFQSPSDGTLNNYKGETQRVKVKLKNLLS